MDKPSRLDAVKTITRDVVAYSVWGTITVLVQSHTPAKNKTQVVTRLLGSWVVASMVAEAAEAYVGHKLDKFAATMQKALAEVESKTPE